MPPQSERALKLHLSTPTDRNVFTGYGKGYVLVNHVRFERSLIVLPERLLEDWPVAGFESLERQHFQFLLDLGPEIVLLGTGPRLRFPSPEIVAPLTRAKVGLEVMDTHAACRTYNILAAEDRKVLAALLFT